MSALFRLHTNEHPNGRIVRSTDAILRANMWIYIRAKQRKGYPLAEIVYSWTKIHPPYEGSMVEEGA